MRLTGTSRRASGWVRRFFPAEYAQTRVVCLPHAGGSASYYRPLVRALPPSVDAIVVQYPGRQERYAEALVDSVDELANRVVEELRHWSDRPLAIFGHSMGATVAFEVALRLQRTGTPPVGLFASGRRAPSRPWDERLHLCGDDELLAQVRRLSGTDSELLDSAEMMRLALPALRADYRAVETYQYQPGPPLACPIVALVGADDPHVSVAEIDAWRAHTRMSYEVEVFQGGHFYLAEHTSAVATTIATHLARWAAPDAAAGSCR